MIKHLALCTLLFSRVLFANDPTQITQLEKDKPLHAKVRSCSALYKDSDVKTASNVLLKKGCMACLGVGALACAIVGTVLTAGAAGPIAIPGGVAACALAGGKSVFDAIELKDPCKSYFNDRRMSKILNQASELVKNPKTSDLDDLTDFYNKKYPTSGNHTKVEKIPTLSEVAQLLIQQDNTQALCKVTDLGPCEGTFVTFLMEDEIVLTSDDLKTDL